MATLIKPCRYGLFAFSPADTFVGRSLDILGEYSEEEVSLLCSLLPVGGVAIDVGANIGCMTVPLAQVADFVVAIEPQRVTFQHLCANAAINGLRNVVTLQAAAAELPGSSRIAPVDFDAPQNVSSAVATDVEGGETTRVLTLDSLELPACHLLKIDAEGWDSRVLAGASNMIGAMRPTIYVEAIVAQQVAEIRQRLEPLGYLGYSHKPSLFNPRNFRGVSENPFPGHTSSNLLFLPDARAVPGSSQLISLK